MNPAQQEPCTGCGTDRQPHYGLNTCVSYRDARGVLRRKTGRICSFDLSHPRREVVVLGDGTRIPLAAVVAVGCGHAATPDTHAA